MSAPEILTAQEVAEILRMPKSPVGDLARRGDLPSIKVGKRRLCLRADLMSHIESLRQRDAGGGGTRHRSSRRTRNPAKPCRRGYVQCVALLVEGLQERQPLGSRGRP